MRNQINPERGDGLQPYDRPGQSWRCGNEEAGCPCAVGPLAKGSCPETTECTPIKEGDRWICNRSAVRGGLCDDLRPGGGPSPEGQCCLVQQCQPKRTLRFIRGRWARGAAIFAIGALLMLLGSGSRNDLLAPGPLTSHHAQVIHRDQWQQRCATCHPGANGSALSWVGRAIGLSDSHPTIEVTPEAAATQSALCLKCHENLRTDRRSPLFAHGISQELIRTINPINSPAFQQASFEATPHVDGNQNGRELACAVCHQEHHGAEHNLSAITNARCQSCHAEQFAGFASGHPEFKNWPSTDSTRIAFNHVSHQGKHFVTANQTFDCRSCHTEDAQGDLTTRASYDQSCGTCHDGSLRKSFEQGIGIAALPSIDDIVMQEAGLPTFEWPKAARSDFDGQLPILMKLLLSADPEAASAMQALGEDFTFFDIDPDNPEDVARAATLLQAVRALLDDLQEEGHETIGYRLRQLTGQDKLSANLSDYVSHLPIGLVDQLQATWFQAAGTTTTETFEEIQDRETAGGWKLDKTNMALTYQATGHDDRFLKAWLDLIVALPAERASLRDAALAEFSRPGAAGACLTCHTIEPNAQHQLAINWEGRQRLTEPKGFTHFSHRPHLTQPELANCTACHQLNTDKQTTSLVSHTTGATDRPDFIAIQQATCVSCHQPQGASDNCTQCHNYHVSPAALLPRNMPNDAQHPSIQDRERSAQALRRLLE